jgi:hypothetical protein
MLIAGGAILAFAVNYQLSGIDINAVGWILMLIGVIGLALSALVLGGVAADYDAGPSNVRYVEPAEPRDVVMPHEHRRVDDVDVVYESAGGPRSSQEVRIRR